ncbi:hypothetical protein CEXT_128981 [Caerostris extrusa]|uniref:Secreted protein n=1 Tax=Caerostris extrusa TaxID=172846 RepID=A0AAV4TQK0_CAEEX|nr:hypothetical protein CEXT_128981 [Caerostris extrusa]
MNGKFVSLYATTALLAALTSLPTHPFPSGPLHPRRRLQRPLDGSIAPIGKLGVAKTHTNGVDSSRCNHI